MSTKMTTVQTRFRVDYGWASFGPFGEIPYVTRPPAPGIKYVPLKLINTLKLNNYSIKSQILINKLNCSHRLEMKKNEVDILNHLWTSKFGKSAVSCNLVVSDLIVMLSDLHSLFESLRPVCPKVAIPSFKEFLDSMEEFKIHSSLTRKALQAPVPFGWILMKDTMIPFVVRGQRILLPIDVLRNAAELLVDVDIQTVACVSTEVDCLNHMCKRASFEFRFEIPVMLVDLANVAMFSDNCDIRLLPPNDPLSAFVKPSLSVETVATDLTLNSLKKQAEFTTHRVRDPPDLIPLTDKPPATTGAPAESSTYRHQKKDHAYGHTRTHPYVPHPAASMKKPNKEAGLQSNTLSSLKLMQHKIIDAIIKEPAEKRQSQNHPHALQTVPVVDYPEPYHFS